MLDLIFVTKNSREFLKLKISQNLFAFFVLFYKSRFKKNDFISCHQLLSYSPHMSRDASSSTRGMA